ncbi:hypothetical protein R5R35_008489 [Gryllus longicercus]|uniref:Uncharacterized protein n=1 Tax=Gryllus longicercus TaxID=2509291 RepID=A0AAN9YZB7_9ORTH
MQTGGVASDRGQCTTGRRNSLPPTPAGASIIKREAALSRASKTHVGYCKARSWVPVSALSGGAPGGRLPPSGPGAKPCGSGRVRTLSVVGVSLGRGRLWFDGVAAVPKGREVSSEAEPFGCGEAARASKTEGASRGLKVS